jgi:trimeric autotransporter adhesin
MRLRLSLLFLLATLNFADAQQYVINTVAGGAPPQTPAAAIHSSFPSPGGLAIDPAGNLYAVSQNCVFTISPSGVMNRIAGIARAGFSGDGGPALNAQFNVPLGLALDAALNVYVADSVNNRIRKISATDGSVSTVAGNGTAGIGGDGTPAIGDHHHHRGQRSRDRRRVKRSLQPVHR